MEDSRSETRQQRHNRLHDEEHARTLLKPGYLDPRAIPLFTNHIDSFVSQSRGNERVNHVYLYPYSFNDHDDEVWDKVGQAIGSLQALE